VVVRVVTVGRTAMRRFGSDGHKDAVVETDDDETTATDEPPAL